MASHGIPRVSGTAVDKSDQAKEKISKQIEQYKQLEQDVAHRISAHDYSSATLQLTSQLLTRNPEYYTIWNHRRVLLSHVFAKELLSPDLRPEQADLEAAQSAGLTLPQREILLLLKEDLQFLLPLLKQYPKCYWIWNHRSWLLTQATQHLPVSSSLELWQIELGLVAKMLSLDSRNFHGWGYRREVVKQIENLSGKSMCEKEFEYTTKMIHSNLSNFSAWHNRGQLIPRLLDERSANNEDRKKLLDAEFEQITTALYTDPYDQSLWFYHQFLMSTFDENNPKSPKIMLDISNKVREEYLEREIENVKDMLDGAEDCKYIYQALLEYSSRYLEMDDAQKNITTMEMKAWLDELRKIDPLRSGRWDDLGRKLKL